MNLPLLRARLHRLFAVDLRALAALRIALALLILWDLALRLPFLEETFTDGGVWPRALVAETGPLFAFYLIGGDPWVPQLLFGLTALFALALLAGHWTRVATLGCWLLVTSLQLRFEPASDGGDALLRALLFWSLFAPLGARWSLDAAQRPPPDGPRVVSPGGVALLLQFVFLYSFAGLLKTADTWQDGTAIQLALSWTDRARPLAGVLLGFPGLLALLTPMVRWFEILAPLLLFIPVYTERIRLVVLAGFALLQLGFGVCLELHLFPWISTSAALPLLPSSFWDALERRVRRPGAAAAHAAPRVSAAGTRRGRLQPVAALGVGVLVLYAFAANLQSTGWIRLPRAVVAWGETLGIQQSWTLFAPGPPTWNAVFQVYGQLADGSTVDLMRADARGDWAPVVRFQRFVRLRNHLERMVRPPRPEPGARHYLRWLCRRWNAAPAGVPRLERVRLLFVREFATDRPEPPQRFRLREYECPGGA